MIEWAARWATVSLFSERWKNIIVIIHGMAIYTTEEWILNQHYFLNGILKGSGVSIEIQETHLYPPLVITNWWSLGNWLNSIGLSIQEGTDYWEVLHSTFQSGMSLLREIKVEIFKLNFKAGCKW